LSQNNDCAAISIETIYGRNGERRPHYDGEEIGIVGLRLWYSKPFEVVEKSLGRDVAPFKITYNQNDSTGSE
jgi:hypothetical protein